MTGFSYCRDLSCLSQTIGIGKALMCDVGGFLPLDAVDVKRLSDLFAVDVGEEAERRFLLSAFRNFGADSNADS